MITLKIQHSPTDNKNELILLEFQGKFEFENGQSMTASGLEIGELKYFKVSRCKVKVETIE